LADGGLAGKELAVGVGAEDDDAVGVGFVVGGEETALIDGEGAEGLVLDFMRFCWSMPKPMPRPTRRMTEVMPQTMPNMVRKLRSLESQRAAMVCLKISASGMWVPGGSGWE
jgi:hypothetical protein